MTTFRTRGGRMALRETLLVLISAGASFVFINHAALYLNEPFVLRDVRLESYVLATVVLFLFLRLAILAVEMRPPRGHEELVRCPECGQWIDGRSAAERDAHRARELTPKPSPKEIVSAVALRKAVDAARLGPLKPVRVLPKDLPPAPPENPVVSSEDLVAALDDPDRLERLRHSPGAPTDPKLKR